MKVRWVLGFLPAFIQVVNDIAPDVGGRRWLGPFIRVLTEYAQDEGLIQHELQHVRFWYLTFGLSSLLELVFPQLDIWDEAKAYQVQLKYYPDDRLRDFAERLASPHYGFGITVDQAEQAIKDA